VSLGRPVKNRRGIALILALLVTALLVSLVVDFSYTMRLDVVLAANLRDEIKAGYAARSGVELAKVILQEDDETCDTLEEAWAHFSEHSGMIGEDDEGRFRGMIVDEASKLDINSTLDDQGEILPDRREQLVRLFELLGHERELVDAIVDWLDKNDDEEPAGAETAYYESLSPPYTPKNGPLSCVQELMRVKGMTEEILYGKDDTKGLVDYLTIYSEEGRVNLNTASALVLQSLSSEVDESLAQAIISYREDEGFTSADDMTKVPGLSGADIGAYVTTKSSYFSVRVVGEMREIRKEIFTVMKRSGKEVNSVFWRMD